MASFKIRVALDSLSTDHKNSDSEELPSELVMSLQAVAPENAGSAQLDATNQVIQRKYLLVVINLRRLSLRACLVQSTAYPAGLI